MTRTSFIKTLMVTAAMLGSITCAQAQYANDPGYDPAYAGPESPNVSKAFNNGLDANAPMLPPGQRRYGGVSSNSVITDPQQVRDCLCLQTRYETMRNDVASRQQAYDQAMQQDQALQQQLAGMKSAGASPEALTQMRQVSQQRIETQRALNASYIPALQQATDRYNGAVGNFQRMCGGKSYDTDVLNHVKPGLVCNGG